MIGYHSGNVLLASTMAFGTLCTARLVHGFNCKDEKPVIFKKKLFNNIYLFGAFFLGLALITLVLKVPVFKGVFKVQALTWMQLLEVYGLAFINLPVVQAIKAVRWVRKK